MEEETNTCRKYETLVSYVLCVKLVDFQEVVANDFELILG